VSPAYAEGVSLSGPSKVIVVEPVAVPVPVPAEQPPVRPQPVAAAAKV
jgi:hypothetical protein